jgi:hypothetical protein
MAYKRQRVLNAGEARRVFLKKSLGIKNPKEANAAAPHVMVEFSLGIPQDRLSRMTDDYEDWDAQEQLA